MSTTSSNPGFTRLEMIVTGSILLLIGIAIIQWLPTSREHARLTQCQNNLKSFGLAMLDNAARSNDKKYCSGAFDYLGDGCIDSYGWVADMVNINGLKPGEMLCPSQPTLIEQPYQELLNMAETQSSRLTPELQPRLQEGYCARMLSHLKPGSEARKKHINTEFKSRGYATNYATSWFLTRGGLKSKRIYAEGASDADSPIEVIILRPIRDLSATNGPLTYYMVNAAETTSSNIPLLGDSRATTTHQGITSTRSGNYGAITYDIATETLIHLDDFADTKILLDDLGYDKQICSRDSEVLSYKHSSVNAAKYVQHFGDGDNLWMQDSRAWGINHRDIKMNYVSNILFADGSVKSFIDINGDGMLNPGFCTKRKGANDVEHFDGLQVELEPFMHYNRSILNTKQLYPTTYPDGS